MSDLVLKVEGVSKKFCRNLKKSMLYAGVDLTKSLVGMSRHQASLREQEFWAVDSVSLELKKGEALGLIGVNGSGKSTLLRLIAGLLPIDKGQISINGSVASMIAVGAGFHGHMTGRENISLNAAILGMGRDFVKEKLDWIVDFADISDFLDAPVATYSSGMRIRLGFAIASAAEPDLLLLDEILAVGDRQFRVKCYNRIAELQKNCAIVFVSHNMNDITRVCNKSLLIHKSKSIFLGDVDLGVKKYFEFNRVGQNSFVEVAEGFFLKNIEINKSRLNWKDSIEFKICFKASVDMNDTFVRITFHDDVGQSVANWQSKNYGLFYDVKKGANEIVGSVQNISMKTGEYKISFVLSSKIETDYLIVANEYSNIFIDSVSGYTSYQL